MSLVFIDGFEYNAFQRYALSTTAGLSTGRNGLGSSLRLNGDGQEVRKLVPARDTYICGVAVRNAGLDMNGRPIFRFTEDPASYAAGMHVGIVWDYTTERIYVTRGPNLPGTTIRSGGVRPVLRNTWNYIEARVKVHDTLGEVKVFVNGLEDTGLTATGLDTRHGATGIINHISLHGYTDAYYDDFHILNEDGTVNNTFIGDCRVESDVPVGVGNSAQFTPSAGATWQNVDDGAPDDDTTYNASSTVGHKDVHALGDLAMTAGVVKGVQLSTRWRKDDAGARTARRIIRSGGTDYEGGDVAMLDSYVTDVEVLENDPATAAAWDIAGYNAMQVGYKVQA